MTGYTGALRVNRVLHWEKNRRWTPRNPGPLRSITRNMVKHFASQSPLPSLVMYMYVAPRSNKHFVFVSSLRLTVKIRWLLLAVYWWTWFDRISSSVAYRYKKIHLDYRNVLYRYYRFPTLLNPWIAYLSTACSAVCGIWCMTGNRHILDSMFLSGIFEQLLDKSSNKHCCVAYVWMKWALFRIAMHRYSVPISHFPL